MALYIIYRRRDLFAPWHVVVWIYGVAILVFGADKEANEWRRISFVDHRLDLPDHAAFAHARVGEPGSVICRVIEKFVFTVKRRRIGGRSQAGMIIELEQISSIFNGQGWSGFLAKIDAGPTFVSGGNQESLRSLAMEDEIERGGAENESRDEKGKTKDGADHQSSAHKLIINLLWLAAQHATPAELARGLLHAAVQRCLQRQRGRQRAL
jgi:hypothetical protein